MAYAGILMVSQMMRVSLGEANMLWAGSSSDAPDIAPVVLGAAVTVAPALGLIATCLTLVVSHSLSFAVATGLGVLFVSLADTTRYALLARGRVRRSVGFDMTWTISELIGLLILWSRGTFSPALLLVVWVLSGAVAVLAALGVVRPASPRHSLSTVARNPHWWRLALNEAIITGSAYALLATLAIAEDTAAVGAVRAAMLPYLWVQLGLSAIWLVVLSRQPSETQLRRFSLMMGELVLGAIVLTVAAIRLLPDEVGRKILGARWDALSRLAVYAALAYAALAVAELLILQLKARAKSGSVLNARLVGAGVTLMASILIVLSPSPEVAFVGIVAAHSAVAAVALIQRARDGWSIRSVTVT